jgi:hypothetical protein
MPHPQAATAQKILSVNRELNRVEAELDRVQGAAPDLHQQREIKATADRFEPLYKDLGLSQPQPRADEDPLAFQIRNLSGLKRWAPDWKDATSRKFAVFAECGSLPDVEAEILQAARRRADDPELGVVGAPHELRKVDRRDEHGNVVTTFHGSPLSWMAQFMTPVVSCLKAVSDGKGRWFPEERN